MNEKKAKLRQLRDRIQELEQQAEEGPDLVCPYIQANLTCLLSHVASFSYHCHTNWQREQLNEPKSQCCVLTPSPQSPQGLHDAVETCSEAEPWSMQPSTLWEMISKHVQCGYYSQQAKQGQWR